jgi:prolyl oligopeptidase
MAHVADAPPPTQVEPVTEVLHGVEVVDPYRWLEDQGSPRTREWIEEQTAYTSAYLSAIPGRERIRERIEQLLAVEMESEPCKIGNRYFFLKRHAVQEQPAIVMREADSGVESVLFDPNLQSDAEAVFIMKIARDASLLAFGIRRTGDDRVAVGFVDVESKRLLSDRIPLGNCLGLAFSPDKRGVYYASDLCGAEEPHQHAIRWHAFSTENEEDCVVFGAGNDPNVQLILYDSPQSPLLGYLKGNFKDPYVVDFYVHDPSGAMAPKLLIDKLPATFFPMFLGDQLIAFTEWKAPNGRIVAVDLDHPQPDMWRDVLPESDNRIEEFVYSGGQILVGYVQDLAKRIEIVELSGKRRGILPCAPGGTPRALMGVTNSDTLFFSYTSFCHPPTIFSYGTQTDSTTVWAPSRVPFEPSSFEIEQTHYTSRDGTEIPISLVALRGRLHAGPHPALLIGYGGFGTSLTPQFTSYATCLIEHGFLFAVANLRGGSEFGASWHEAAKRRKRQNAFDDFISAAEWLLASGHAAPGKLAIAGGSNAGLLVGAAITQRPDLFRAVICLGALFDMLRYHKFDEASDCIEEYGSAEIPEDFPHLRAYSPYHNVEQGTAYPAVFLITGDSDTRCNPMHTRKMAARLQAASSSDHPILLDYKSTWGHMPVQPLSKRIEALTDRLVFLCHELQVSL